MRCLSVSRSVWMSILVVICIIFGSGAVSAHERAASQRMHNLQELKANIQQVQKISTTNSAAFVMNFSVQYLNINTGEVGTVGGTDNYPVGQQRTLDLDALGVPDGALVRPSVNAILGTSNFGDQYVRYVKGNGGVATYHVTGTTFNFSVSLIQ
jgi:hypothetical protein